MFQEDTNQNRKRHTEMKLTGKNARKKSNKRAKLHKVPEGTSQTKNLQNWSFVGISKKRHMALRHGEAI